MTGPAQVCFQDLAHIHTAGYAERVKYDFYRSAVCKIRHIFLGQNAGNHAFVAVTACHLVAHAEFALHGHVALHQLDHAGREFIALLQLADFLVGDLAQHVDLARGHLFDFVNLLINARVLVSIFNALQVTRGNPLNRLAIKHGSLGQKAFVGALVMQVSLDFFISQDGLKTLQALIGQDSDFVSQVLLQPLNLRRFNGLCAFVFFLSFAGEDFYVDDRAFDARRARQRSVTHIAGFFAEDRTQQLLFRSELGLALGRYLAHNNVALLYRGANADHAALIQVAQRRFAYVRDVAGNFLGPQLRVSSFNLKLFNVDGGVVILLHHLF